VPLDGAWLPHRHVIEGLMFYIEALPSIPVAGAHSKSSKTFRETLTKDYEANKQRLTLSRSVSPQKGLQY
jgi:hypothetical protein